MSESDDRLTARQRDVLRGLAERKTNAQIAEDLGLSPETVKSHVSEILGELGVDTREEAAEWWRQQRGMRARFAVADRFSRMPALLRWGLGGAGAAAAVGVVAVVALVLLFDGESAGSVPGDAPPGLAVAYVIPQGEAPDEQEQASLPDTELAVLHPAGEASFGGGYWLATRWSPDGSMLAAIRFEPPDPGETISPPVEGTLLLYDPDAGEQTEVDVPGGVGLSRTGVSWSPDGERLAVNGAEGVTLLAPAGDVLATVGGPEAGVLPAYPAQGVFALGGGRPWTADSEYLAIAGESLAIVDRDGGRVAEVAADRLRDIARDELEEGEQLGPLAEQLFGVWTPEGALDLVFQARAENSQDDARMVALRGTLQGGELEWQVVPDFEGDPGQDEFYDPSHPKPPWAPLGEGERFDNGVGLLSRRYEGDLHAGWIAYTDSGEQPLPGGGPDRPMPGLEQANMALVLNHGGSITAYEPDFDGGWIGQRQFSFPFDVARVE